MATWGNMPQLKKTLILPVLVLYCLSSSWLYAAGPGKEKPGPLTGTWECLSHGGAEGDLAFTLYLTQAQEVITGSVSSPRGAAQIASGSFREKLLELHIDAQKGNYVVVGRVSKNQMSGTWTRDNGEKGTWEGKKVSDRN